MINNDFENQFHEYLYSSDIKTLNDDSKYSYESYVRNLCNHFLNDYAHKLSGNDTFGFIELLYCLESSYRSKLLYNAGRYVDGLKQQMTCVAPKTLSNYSSGFSKLIEMFYNDEPPKVKCPTGLNVSLVCKAIDSEYDSYQDKVCPKGELLKIFMNRLRTQDRYYSEIKFPIRIILKLASQYGFGDSITNAMKERIDDMEFILSDDGKKTVKFKRINDFVFTKTYVRINKRHKLYTEKYDKKANANTFVLQEPVMGNISIDHDNCMYKLLTEHIEDYPYLKRLSDDIDSVIKGKRLKTASSKAREYITNRNLGKSEVEGICDETVRLFNNMKFVIMDKRYNSSKNKSK